jgi:predicted nucleic acid-binding protein
MQFVLDASVTVAWCFNDEATTQTTALLESLENGKAFVPAIWPLEIGNVLISAQKRQRISYADIMQFLDLLKNINIHVDLETVDKSFHEVFSLAHTENLTTYDAAYLELAMRMGIPLATKDRLLQQACNRLGVELSAV